MKPSTCKVRRRTGAGSQFTGGAVGETHAQLAFDFAGTAGGTVWGSLEDGNQVGPTPAPGGYVVAPVGGRSAGADSVASGGRPAPSSDCEIGRGLRHPGSGLSLPVSKSASGDCSAGATQVAEEPNRALSPVGVVSRLPGVHPDDRHVIEAWVLARCHDGALALGDQPSHTGRAYRREACRFALWLATEYRIGLAQASVMHCTRFRDFLADPQPAERWCAPRGTPTTSPDWRPFEGPLSPRSRRQALVILGALYRFLAGQGLLPRNPWDAVAMPRNSMPGLDPQRSLTARQWSEVLGSFNAGATDPRQLQLHWAVRFLHSTGLRQAEIAAATCGDVRWVESGDEECQAGDVVHGPSQIEGCAGGWVVRVRGKGGKLRDVPVPAVLVAELGALVAMDAATEADRISRARRPLLVVWARGRGPRATSVRPLGGSALYKQLKTMFADAAQRAESAGRQEDADALRRSSTHWLRHTFARRAVAAGVPIDVVMADLGHASLATTTIYTRPGLARVMRETARLHGRDDVSPAEPRGSSGAARR